MGSVRLPQCGEGRNRAILCMAVAKQLLSLRRHWAGLYRGREEETLSKCGTFVWLESQSTYIYRVQSSVWRLPNYWPPTPSPPSECVLPCTKGGERGVVHTRQAVRGWGVNSSEDARHWIGLLQYNPSTVRIVGSIGWRVWVRQKETQPDVQRICFYNSRNRDLYQERSLIPVLNWFRHWHSF